MAGIGGILAGSAYVKLYAESSQYVRGLRTAEQKLSAFGNAAGTIGRRITMMAVAAAAPIALASKTFANFQDQLLAVQAVTKATGAEFDRLYNQAKKLGADTSFTAMEVGAGQLNLGRSGFNPREIEAAIPSVLDLSRATGTELAEAADIAAGTLRAFNLDAAEMPRVADVLTAAANNSAQTLTDLGESMSYVAPIAYEYGLSLEQTSKALGVLANMSIKGSMAGTSLRQMMLRLADPKVQEQLKGLGIETVDLAGNLLPLGDIMIEIGKAMASMGTGERLALGKELFDQRAVASAMKLATTDFPALSKAIDESAGAAKEASDIMDKGLGGAFRMLESAVEGLQISIGEALTSELTRSMDMIQKYADAGSEWVKNNKEVVVTILEIIAVVGAAGVSLVALGAIINSVAAIAGAATLAGALLNPVVLAIGIAAGAAAIAFALWGDEINAALLPAFKRLSDVWKNDVLPALDDIGEAFGELYRQATPLMDLFGKLVVADIQAFSNVIRTTADSVHLLVAAYERLSHINLKGLNKPGITPAIPGDQAPATDATPAAVATGKHKLDEFFSGYSFAGSGGGGVSNAAEETAKKAAEITKKISELRIAAINDESSRELAAINARYDAEIAAVEGVESLRLQYEQARKLEIANLDMETKRKKDEEKTRKEKEVKKAEQEVADQIKRQEIENRWSAQLPGDMRNQTFRERQKDAAMLELERQIALRDAKAAGQDTAPINDLYDMKYAALQFEQRAANFSKIDPTASTYSASSAFRLGLGGKVDDKSVRATKEVKGEVARGNKVLENIEKNTRAKGMGR